MKVKFKRKYFRGGGWTRNRDQFNTPLPDALGHVTIDLELTHSQFLDLERQLKL